MLEAPQSRAPSPQMPIHQPGHGHEPQVARSDTPAAPGMQTPTVNPGDQVWQPVPQVDVSTPGSDADDNDRPALISPAFREKPHIRMTYLQAVINNVYANIPVQQTTDIMNNTLDAFSVAGVLPTYPRPVRTLESAKRRLGLDADQHITQYSICPKCWKHYTPKQILQANSSDCLVPGCDGKIYEEYTNRKLAGHMKRRPIKVNPYTSIIHTLKRFFMRPGFARMIKDSRLHPENQNNDPDFIMRDIHDGAAWHRGFTNSVREVGDMGTVRDVPRNPGPREKLTSHRFGLHLTLNTDWYIVLYIFQVSGS